MRDEVLQVLHMRYQDGRFVNNQPSSTDWLYSGFGRELSKIIQHNPGITTSGFEEKADRQGIPRQDARRFLKRAVAEKIVNAIPGNRNSKRHYWHDATPIADAA
jgi:hypothetical protein